MFSYIRCVFFLALAILFFGSAPPPLSAQAELGNTPPQAYNIYAHTHDPGCATPEKPGPIGDDLNTGPDCGQAGPGVLSYWVSKFGEYEARNGPESGHCNLVVPCPWNTPNFYWGQGFVRNPIDYNSAGEYPQSEIPPERWWDSDWVNENAADWLWISTIERFGLLSVFFQFYQDLTTYIPWGAAFTGHTPYWPADGFSNSEVGTVKVDFKIEHMGSSQCRSSPNGTLWDSRFTVAPTTRRYVIVDWVDTQLRMKDGRHITLKPDVGEEAHYYRLSAAILDPPDPSTLEGGVTFTFQPELFGISLSAPLTAEIPVGVKRSLGIKYQEVPLASGNLNITENCPSIRIEVDSYAECIVNAAPTNLARDYFPANTYFDDPEYRRGITQPTEVIGTPDSSGAEDEDGDGVADSFVPWPCLQEVNQPMVLPRDGLVDAPGNILVSTLWNGCDSSCFLIDLEGLLYDPEEMTPQKVIY